MALRSLPEIDFPPQGLRRDMQKVQYQWPKRHKNGLLQVLHTRIWRGSAKVIFRGAPDGHAIPAKVIHGKSDIPEAAG
jgi:hypothetical protein